MIIQVSYPMRGSSRDAQTTPAGVHHFLRHGITRPAYIPTGQEQGGIGAACVLETVEVENECRVRAMAPTEPVLTGGEGLIMMETDDLAYHDPDPELPQDLK